MQSLFGHKKLPNDVPALKSDPDRGEPIKVAKPFTRPAHWRDELLSGALFLFVLKTLFRLLLNDHKGSSQEHQAGALEGSQ